MYTDCVIFAKQDSHVWDSIFRMPLLCLILSPSLAISLTTLRAVKKSKLNFLSQLSIL